MSPLLDPNVEAVRDRLRRRADAGFLKYGVTTAEADLDLVAWLRHLQEELLDAAVYVEASIGKLSGPVDELEADLDQETKRLAELLAPIPVLDAVPDQARPSVVGRGLRLATRLVLLTWIGGLALSVVWAIYLASRP